MPFGDRRDRNKPKLSDRLRGKSTDEILEEIKREFGNNARGSMFFNESDSRTSPQREEFPFDDDMLRGHLSVRSHLEDLAKRHPDLAGHLRCPPWGGEPSSKGWNRKRTVSGEDNSSEGPSDLNQNQAECTESSPDKKRFEENMDKQQQQPPFENNSRSQENEDKPQRFVSKLEFTPVNSNNQPENVQQPAQPQQHQHQKESHNDTFTSSQGAQKQSNVRHIPIYVEGRSEPVYPKNVEQIFSENNGSTLPKRASGKPTPFAQHHSFHDQNTAQRRQTPPSQQQRQQTPPQESRSTPPPPPRQQVKPIDALEKVQNVQAEVDELATAVNQFTGSLRTDKQYIYLDEMLTRNLIKLDTIETEGRDDVRTARKKAIKTIQDTISILESKVPQPQEETVKTENLTENPAEAVLVESETPETEQVKSNG